MPIPPEGRVPLLSEHRVASGAQPRAPVHLPPGTTRAAAQAPFPAPRRRPNDTADATVVRPRRGAVEPAPRSAPTVPPAQPFLRPRAAPATQKLGTATPLGTAAPNHGAAAARAVASALSSSAAERGEGEALSARAAAAPGEAPGEAPGPPVVAEACAGDAAVAPAPRPQEDAPKESMAPAASEGTPKRPRLAHSRTSRMFVPAECEEPEPPKGKQLGAFNYVIVFPMPSATTAEEEESFRKQHLSSGASHRDLLMLLVEHTGVKERLDTELHISSVNSLRSLRAAAIEMFHSLFESLFASYEDDVRKARIFCFASADGDELFMCVSPGDIVSEALADVGEYCLQLDTEALGELGIKLSDPDVVPAYVKFDQFQKTQGLLRLHERPEAEGVFSVLRKVDRVRLLYDQITDYLNLAGFERLGLITHSYPVHDIVVVKRLMSDWGRLRLVTSLTQPIDDIRDYFGEKIAFYFLFVETLGRAELLLLVFALITMAFQVALSETDFADLPQVLYSCVLIMWFMCFAKYWRRKQAIYSNMWGMEFMDNDEIKEPVNPRFQGRLSPSPLDESKLVLRPDKRKRFFGAIVSVAVQASFMALIITAVSLNQYYAAVSDARGNTTAFQLAAVLLTVQIKVFDYLWTMVATTLTDLEQKVTLQAYDQSKARKIFMMKFVNTFYSFFYIAFFEQVLDPKGCAQGGGCKSLLKTNLYIVYLTYITFGVLDVVLPVATFKVRVWMEARAMRKTGKVPVSLSLLEEQAKMNVYDGDECTADYLQIALPMYFFVLFSMVSPLFIVGLATVALATQLRADAWKLLVAYRRAFPFPSDGIGIWDDIVTFLEFLGVAVNVLLMLNQLDFVRLLVLCPIFQEEARQRPMIMKSLSFFVLLAAFILFRMLLNMYVSDEPAELKLRKAQQELQRVRLFQQQTAEDKASIELRAIGTNQACKTAEAARPLLPGDPMFEEPMV